MTGQKISCQRLQLFQLAVPEAVGFAYALKYKKKK